MKIKYFNNKIKIKPILTDYFFHFKNFRNNPYQIKGNAVFSAPSADPLEYYKIFNILDQGIVECSKNESINTMPLFELKFNSDKIKSGELKKIAEQMFTPEFPQHFRLKLIMDSYIQNKNRQNFIMSKNLCSALLKAPQAPNLSILPFKIGGDYFLEFCLKKII